MAKRSADEQITREGLGLSHNSNEDVCDERASADIISKRKILQPKGRNFQFSRRTTESSTKNTNSTTPHTEKAEKLKALGNNFSKAVLSVKLDQCVPDYRALAKKYLMYYEEIEIDAQSTGKVNASKDISGSKDEVAEMRKGNDVVNPFAGVSTSNKKSSDVKEISELGNISDESELQSDGEKIDVKIHGPKFSLSAIPTTKSTTFSFGPKKSTKKANSDSDSEPEVEVKGPSFTFNKEIKDPVFKLPANQAISSGFVAQRVTISKPNEAIHSKFEALPVAQSSGFTSLNVSHGSELPNNDVFSQKPIQDEKASTEENINSNNEIKPILENDDDGESVLFEVKAKLMLLRKDNAKDPYQSLGVGELKLLKSLKRSTLRVLLRAEGGLRLLLNALLLKDVQYSTLGNGSFVRLPALDDQHQIVTYVLKVGSAEKASKLCDALNAAKIN
ncbi:hypothetical protein METBIDRAFT_115009 [Metschnikowia bicuspidata var. bicuspidata NRRL YB-4993]|uniref:RanBD1 domain-containing protein n=1 Tax=Metschnikowia bicuspidata var. bicuspidata NRRL YB-4993 TaxID=869754 RepID=A0A1A0HID9_9ASCO|nr:hypothetical protein METBIDRAFT_115009 [Metschnikowia bicuspidata var. bicuspidata NRRL YB-4993]OBA23934.1 hypothetical protein METBIDRAFT_115009 [Metschnikowia bicuspidata var. bicuspidata NRRL YB-4993]